ncbi:MAG: hypothetical protein OSP8Acid_14370 [uncultured Acidilobus sp. OSP8]|nr:MAG: hypothetical protein OSP8Acid_14370 [uncultured Acidilobus sp. OSP8]
MTSAGSIGPSDQVLVGAFIFSSTFSPLVA